jgi:REP element-mobilizing transposase RayT
MTQRFRKLSHTLYECKYHIIFCPKYRFRVLRGELADYSKHLWARGYCVSTVGIDEEKVRKYVQWQESNKSDYLTN